jgi:hypothetical protein
MGKYHEKINITVYYRNFSSFTMGLHYENDQAKGRGGLEIPLFKKKIGPKQDLFVKKILWNITDTANKFHGEVLHKLRSITSYQPPPQ